MYSQTIAGMIGSSSCIYNVVTRTARVFHMDQLGKAANPARGQLNR